MADQLRLFQQWKAEQASLAKGVPNPVSEANTANAQSPTATEGLSLARDLGADFAFGDAGDEQDEPESWVGEREHADEEQGENHPTRKDAIVDLTKDAAMGKPPKASNKGGKGVRYPEWFKTEIVETFADLEMWKANWQDAQAAKDQGEPPDYYRRVWHHLDVGNTMKFALAGGKQADWVADAINERMRNEPDKRGYGKLPQDTTGKTVKDQFRKIQEQYKSYCQQVEPPTGSDATEQDRKTQDQLRTECIKVMGGERIFDAYETHFGQQARLQVQVCTHKTVGFTPTLEAAGGAAAGSPPPSGQAASASHGTQDVPEVAAATGKGAAAANDEEASSPEPKAKKKKSEAAIKAEMRRERATSALEGLVERKSVSHVAAALDRLADVQETNGEKWRSMFSSFMSGEKDDIKIYSLTEKRAYETAKLNACAALLSANPSPDERRRAATAILDSQCPDFSVDGVSSSVLGVDCHTGVDVPSSGNAMGGPSA
eukprot:jgi/Mesvir1/25665/Mv01879-RA.2